MPPSNKIDKGEDERGIYRSIHVSLWDDRDFQALDPNVKLVMLNLRTSPLSNRPCIYPVYIDAIHKQTGLSDTIIKDAIDILCRANWIEYEDGIVWVRKALKFDPLFSLRNDDHITKIRKVIRALPKLAIVDSFLEFYKISMEESPVHKPKTSATKENINRLVNLWNVVCGKVLPKVTQLPETRVTHINARLDEQPDFEFWKEYFYKIVNTPFLIGENERGWKVNFDWVINPTNMTKILEGNWPTMQQRAETTPARPKSRENLWGNCKKCKKECLLTNLNQDGLCFNCNPDAEIQTKRLKELTQKIGKTITSVPPSTSSKSEQTE